MFIALLLNRAFIKSNKAKFWKEQYYNILTENK